MWIKYNIEKKQVSTDRGVTWEDVTPYETRYGQRVSVYNTFMECDDDTCKLEKYEYTFEEKPFPASLCGSLPEGIADTINWISGAICLTSWRWAVPTIYNSYVDQTTEALIGQPICGDGYCPSFGYYTGFSIDGREIVSTTSNGLTACYTVTKFMPWCEGKTTWRTIVEQKYVREHCSDEWIEEGEQEIVGIGERWRLVECTYYRDVYQHQIMVQDGDGNLSWEDEGEPIIIQYETSLPEGVELIDGIELDGSIYRSQWDNTDNMYIELKRNGNQSVGGYMYKVIPETNHYLNLEGFMLSVDEGNEFKTYLRPLIYNNVGSVYTKYSSLFCDTYGTNGSPVSGSGGYGIIAGRLFAATESMRNGTVRKNITTSKKKIYFPARKLVDGTYQYGYIGRAFENPIFWNFSN